MRNPSLTFAWISWRQHHLGLLIAVGLLTLAAIDSMMSAPAQRTREHQEWLVILQFLTVAVAAVMCLVSIFTDGDHQADLIARASGFPSSRFRLPVRTVALVAWPMTYGAVLPAILWLVIAAFILRPWQGPANDLQRIPLWWPAALASAFVAWIQAVVWWPLGLRGLRIVLVFIVGALLVALAVGAALWHLLEMARVALFATVVVLGWIVSHKGVCQARRGDVPDWEGIYDPLTRLWPGRMRPRRLAFHSSARAHDWLQWRIWGQSLPIGTAMIVFLFFVPVIICFPTSTEQMLSFVLATPVLLAGLAGGWLGGGKSRWAKDRAGLSTQFATMPVTDAALLRSTLKTAAISTLATWALVTIVMAAVLVAYVLFVVPTGGLAHVDNLWLKNRLADVQLRPSAAVATVAGYAIWVFVWTWKRALNSYLLGLFGRGWILAEIGLWVFLLAAANSIFFLLRVRPDVGGAWFLGLLLAGRMTLAGWALWAVKRQGLLDAPTIAWCLVAWIVLASAAIGLLFNGQSFNTANRGDEVFLAMGILIAFPMVRLAAMPLILRSARHR